MAHIIANVNSRSLPLRPPLVIVGTAHSGTRVPARIAQHAGFYMGSRLNPPIDGRHLSGFVRRHVYSYFSQHDWVRSILRGADPVPARTPEIRRITKRLENAIATHRHGIPEEGADWGWKSPNSFYLLPLFHHRFPELRVIHIVRDGLDVAYGRSRREFNLYGRLFLEAEELDAPEPVRMMALWSRANLATARYASRHFPERYLRVTLEDLTAEPRRVVARIFEFLGHPAGDAVRAAAAEIVRPASIGRWMHSFGPEIVAVTELGAEALREFGYPTERREQVQILLSRLAEKDEELAALRASRAMRAAAAYWRVRHRLRGAVQALRALA